MHRSFPDSAVFLEADHAFHLAMGEAAGNQVLMDHLELLWALRYQPTFKKFEEHYTNDHGEQLAVLEESSPHCRCHPVAQRAAGENGIASAFEAGAEIVRQVSVD